MSEERTKLILSSGSVPPLDGTKPFEIVVKESDLISMGSEENDILCGQYEKFKEEATAKGYTVYEEKRKWCEERSAFFFPPNTKD